MFCRIVTKLKCDLSHFYVSRWLLTQSYQGDSLWDQRLKNIDCQLSANDLNIKLQASLNNNIPISPLDFDTLTNKINEIDVMNMSYIDTLIKSFRKTQASIKTFESSSHAIIKNLIDIDQEVRAFNLLVDREKTGVFLDEVTANLLMEKFLQDKDWERAFLTSAEWLLQENFEKSDLCQSMSLFAGLHFWNEKLWQYVPPEKEVSNEEEEYVRVTYLAPDSFDDHFDLTKDCYRRRLLGKCLRLAIDNGNLGNGPDGRYLHMNFKLLALALHEKLDAVMNFLGLWLQTEDVKLNESLIGVVGDLIASSEKTDSESPVFHPTYTNDEVAQYANKYQELIGEFRAKDSVDDRELMEFSLTFLSDKVKEQSEKESVLVSKKYEQFNRHRESEFQTTKEKIRNRETLQMSKEKLLELMEQEETIKYFEMMPEIMYKAWLAQRTREEKSFSQELDEKEDLENVKSKEKRKFVVQHVTE